MVMRNGRGQACSEQAEASRQARRWGWPVLCAILGFAAGLLVLPGVGLVIGLVVGPMSGHEWPSPLTEEQKSAGYLYQYLTHEGAEGRGAYFEALAHSLSDRALDGKTVTEVQLIRYVGCPDMRLQDGEQDVLLYRYRSRAGEKLIAYARIAAARLRNFGFVPEGEGSPFDEVGDSADRAPPQRGIPDPVTIPGTDDSGDRIRFSSGTHIRCCSRCGCGSAVGRSHRT